MIKEIKDKTRIQITEGNYRQNLDIEVTKEHFIMNCGAEEISMTIDEAVFLTERINEMITSANSLD
jgi:hypothetical protein